MAIDLTLTARGFDLSLDGTVRLSLDDLWLTAWGEMLRLAAGGLMRTDLERAGGNDEVGVHDVVSCRCTSRSLRHPVQYRLTARTYVHEPTVLLEILPSLGQPVFGTEEAAGVRVGALPGCEQAVYYHQRVSEYGRDAVGCWWAQALPLADPTRDNLWDFGLASVWRYADGLCAALLPMRGGGAVARLRGSECGLEVVSSGWCGRHVYPRLPLFLLAFGHAPADAVDRAVGAAAKLCEWSFRVRGEKHFPEIFEHLGYATWGGLGRTLTAEKVVEALQALHDREVPVRWAVLDEGWQQVDNGQRLQGHGADPTRFPAGLEAAVQTLRGEGRLRHVGLWATLQGGWGGVDPSSPLARSHPNQFAIGVDGTTVPSHEPGGQGFWEDWFAHLGRAGIDVVKVDNQGSARNLYLGREPLDEAVGGSLRNLQHAADAAGMALVGSMSLHTECLLNYRSTNVVRVSGDIVPEDRTAAKLHLVHSVMVGAWVSAIAWPDHDGFPSTHPAARAFALFAALSGGPVYVCDRPGEHDPDLLRSLCLRNGTLLHPAEPARPPASRWFDNPLADDTPLVAVTKAARVPRREPVADVRDRWDAQYPATFVGLANVSLNGFRLLARVNLAELSLPAAGAYAVSCHFTGERRVLRPDEAIEVTLGELEAELVTVMPIRDGRAMLGLRDKLLGACGCLWDDDDVLSLPEMGTVLLYDEREAVPMSIDREPYAVHDGECDLAPGEAWREGAWLMVNAGAPVVRMERG
ncbi:MAG: hypothetical protein HYU66_24025 [Armatimonadetes bacterium]|nr:hypothetical protein [Armatimonadota bacterium]